MVPLPKYRVVFELKDACIQCILETPNHGRLIFAAISKAVPDLHPERYQQWIKFCEELIVEEFKRQTGIDVPVVRQSEMN